MHSMNNEKSDRLLCELLRLRCEIEGMIVDYKEITFKKNEAHVGLADLGMTISLSKSEEIR